MENGTTRDLLAALQLPGVGPTTVRKLWVARSTGQGRSLIETIQPKKGVSITDQKISEAYEKADQIFEESAKRSISLFSPADEEYPRALLGVPDYPLIIYVKGSLKTLGNPKKLAVVGTREASELGARLARKIATELANLNVCVVSGLALGIDSAAHNGAIKGPGSTIAVLAHGLDQVAPKSNAGLAEAILANEGVLLSEYEVGVIPRGPQFVARNRLQSGLSRGSIVVESGHSGGSIYQGKFTTDQQRLLFVVMPDDSLPGAKEFNREGAQRLHKEFGARIVSRLDDVLSAIPEFQAPIEAQPGGGSAIESVPSETLVAESSNPTNVGVQETLALHDQFDAEVKSSLAIHDLAAAELFAERSEAAEQAWNKTEAATAQVRSYAIGAIFTSVAFLEAMVNEIYLSAVDGEPSSPFTDFVQTEAMASAWRESARWSLIQKFDRALEVSGRPAYRKTDRLRGDVDNLIHLRNSLVHYQPEWDSNLKRHKEVERRLVGKFRESVYSQLNQTFFPHRCLGGGCARWAVDVAKDFALDFRTKLGLTEALPLQQALVRHKKIA